MRMQIKLIGFCTVLAMAIAVGEAQTAVTTTGGTANQVPKMSGSATVVDSSITETGGKVGIQTTNPQAGLDVEAPFSTTVAQFAGDSQTYPSVNRGLVIDQNFTGSQAEIDFINTVLPSAFPNPGIQFYQQTDTSTVIPTLRISGNGNVGIGTTSPSQALDVVGNVNLSGNGAKIIFPDGSFQSTGFSGTTSGSVIGGVPAPTTTGVLIAPGLAAAGLMLNQNYLMTNDSNPHAFKIATLPASTAATYDHLHLLATLGSWGSDLNTYIDAVFANRNGFNYQYTVRGSALTGPVDIQAYTNANNDVDLYIVFTGSWPFATASYSIVENQQETVYSPPVDVGAVPTSGLEFAATSAAYPPATYIDYAGNMGIGTTTPGAKLEVNGNIVGDGTLTLPALASSGASNVCVDSAGTLTSSGCSAQSSSVSSLVAGVGAGYIQSGPALQAGTYSSFEVDPSGLVHSQSGVGPIGYIAYGIGSTWAQGSPFFGAFSGNTLPGPYPLWQGAYNYGNGGTPILTSQINVSGDTYFQGNMGIGTATPSVKLEVVGNVKLSGAGSSITFPGDGGTQTVAWNGTTYGGDYAESVDVIGDRKQYEPGDVMVIDPDSPDKFLKASEPYSTMVAGIYSTKPGLTGRRQQTITATWRTDEVPMAMMGIVPTKVSAENGAVKPGDLLVASSTSGYAMKGTDRERLTGAVIGKAMGHLDSGKGVIEVLVSLQ